MGGRDPEAGTATLGAVRRAYIAQLPNKVAALGDAVRAAPGDPTAAMTTYLLAHRLAGSSAIHGLAAVSAAARALEAAAAPARAEARALGVEEHAQAVEALVLLEDAVRAPAEPEAPLRVLLVDDDQDVLDYYGLYLRAAEMIVDEAVGGRAALEAFHGGAYDVIVSDVQMPGLNGYELCRRVRESGSNVPFVFLSILGSATDRLVGLWSGADEYMAKPAAPEDLVERIRRLREGLRAPGVGAEPEVLMIGSLGQVPVPDLLQLVTRRSASTPLRIVLEGGSAIGVVHLDGDRIIHAALRDIEGWKAWCRLLTWSRGSFRVERRPAGGPSTMDEPTGSALVRALVENDEAAVVRAGLGSGDDRLVVAAGATARGRHGEILALARRHGRLDLVLDLSPYSDLDTLLIMESLREAGALLGIEARDETVEARTEARDDA